MKKIYIAMLLAAFALNGAFAQNNTNLNKEITLEKDIAPLEKKAVKKNELPKVKKPTTTGTKTQLGYSDLTTPIEVPTSIPTLLPYGYRTAHNFSDKRGYFDIGAGTQGNFRMDFGYRILNDEREKLGIWLNHNSTWNSKNSSKLITLDENRNKQKYNDNTLAVDYSKLLDKGTLSLGAKGHIDVYNYYGGWNTLGDIYTTGQVFGTTPLYDWNKDKQTFLDFTFNAGWASHFMLRDNPLRYNVGLLYGHAAYDKSFNENYKHGAHDNWGILTLGGSYDINELSVAALNIKGEYLRRGSKATLDRELDLFDEVGMITLSPTYTIKRDMYNLQLGVNAHLSFSDGAIFRLTPNVRFNLALVDGFALFANALGGKNLGYRVPTHFYNHRYDYPLLMYGSIYTPLDAEAGIKIGPFDGLSARISLGYAIVKDQPGILYRTSYPGHALMHGMMTTYMVMDGRGYYLNAEVNYKYRSLIEAKAAIKYAPHDNEMFASDTHYNGYKLGVDRASTVANIDLKVTPWRPLSVNLGLEYRGGRMALFNNLRDENGNPRFVFENMSDVINLHAGANYRLNNNISLWLQAHNLLNRRYDLLYGLGAQRIGFMVGAGFTF
ncbi:MAG: hypothetical protein IKW85_09795 [Muribaculaceae bacterium]|nr:hypothetical protein [Muribaculaceae bacterium]